MHSSSPKTVYLRAEQFAQRWAGRGDEKQETQLFWLELLQKVLGKHDAVEITKFE